MLKDQDSPISIEMQLLGGIGDGKSRPTGNMCSPGTDVVYKGRVSPDHCINSTSKTYDGEQWVKGELIVQGHRLITEAEQSIKREKSVYWKEMLGVLSFSLNYPAKHLSAEDMQRLQQSLTPLISIVIAYIPQSSSEELLALHRAGVLELIPVGDESSVEPHENGGASYHYTDKDKNEQSVHYQTYVDCVGQPHLAFEDLPFKNLIEERTVTPAKLKFSSADEGLKAMNAGKPVSKDDHGDYYLKVSGITINDYFQVVDAYGAYNERIYMMAVPYIGGYNPDYSGLDFSEEASGIIIERLMA